MEGSALPADPQIMKTKEQETSNIMYNSSEYGRERNGRYYTEQEASDGLGVATEEKKGGGHTTIRIRRGRIRDNTDRKGKGHLEQERSDRGGLATIQRRNGGGQCTSLHELGGRVLLGVWPMLANTKGRLPKCR